MKNKRKPDYILFYGNKHKKMFFEKLLELGRSLTISHSKETMYARSVEYRTWLVLKWNRDQGLYDFIAITDDEVPNYIKTKVLLLNIQRN